MTAPRPSRLSRASCAISAGEDVAHALVNRQPFKQCRKPAARLRPGQLHHPHTLLPALAPRWSRVQNGAVLAGVQVPPFPLRLMTIQPALRSALRASSAGGTAGRRGVGCSRSCKTARMLKRRLENILTYLRRRITNAASESLNSKIQRVKIHGARLPKQAELPHRRPSTHQHGDADRLDNLFFARPGANRITDMIGNAAVAAIPRANNSFVFVFSAPSAMAAVCNAAKPAIGPGNWADNLPTSSLRCL